VIRGIGGQGKTQVTLEFCRRGLVDSLFSACFWVDATSESTVRKSFEAIFEIIKPKAFEAQNTEARLRFVMTTLSTLNSPWFIVFDNYDDPVTFANVQDFFPESAHGTILFTTRHADTETLASEGCAFELGGLQSVDAVNLLLRQSQVLSFDKNTQQCQLIAARLGNQAFAIAQAGTYIWKRRIPLEKFLDHYDRRKISILQETPSMSQYRKSLNDAEKETCLNVFVTWELSFQQLVADEEDDTKAHILTLLAFFDPNDIPELLFQEYCVRDHLEPRHINMFGKCLYSALSNSHNPEMTLGIICWGWNHDEFVETLGSLRQLSLIQSFETSEDGRSHVSLHPLVKDWIKLRIKPDVASDYFELAAHILDHMVECVIPVVSRRPDPLIILKKQWVIPHLVELNWNFQEIFERRNIPPPLHLWNAFGNFGNALCVWDWDRDALPWFVRALKYVDAPFVPEIDEVVGCISNLAWTLNGLSDYEAAEPLARQLIAVTLENFPAEHEWNLNAMDLLATILNSLSRHSEAEMLSRKIISIIGQSTAPELGGYLSNYGVRLFRGKQYEEAEPVMRKTVLIQRSQYGPDDPYTIRSLNNHAKVLLELKRLDEAGEVACDALERSERILGPDHGLTISAIHSLAWHSLELGDVGLAERFCQHALSWRMENYASTHPKVVESTALLERINAAEEALSVNINESPGDMTSK
jgi:tetratricopeptide (TPR) repeat protein